MHVCARRTIHYMAEKNKNIKIFIDFFHEAAQKVRKEKPKFTHGKDGKLVKLALARISEQQLEQLALWFLERKRTLSTTIGAMLSRTVLEALEQDMKRPGFWTELASISDTYFPRPDFAKELLKKFQPFTQKQVTEIQEEVSRFENQKKY